MNNQVYDMECSDIQIGNLDHGEGRHQRIAFDMWIWRKRVSWMEPRMKRYYKWRTKKIPDIGYTWTYSEAQRKLLGHIIKGDYFLKL